MLAMSVIDSFSGEFRFLSNFWIVDVLYENVLYRSSEHAYQAAKCKNPEEKILFSNPKLTAAGAKKLGKKVEVVDNWESIKFKVMYDIVTCKFEQNPDLQKLLLNTSNALLIEGNTWGDVYWGQYNGKGQNHLGQILMQIRDKLS